MNGKYLSIFLGVIARIVKVTPFAQAINFRERAHRKIQPRKVDKNNKESTFFLFFFNITVKQSLLSLLQHNSKNKKFLSFFFFSLCFSNGLFTHVLAKGAYRIIIAIINQLSLRCSMTAIWLVNSRLI